MSVHLQIIAWKFCAILKVHFLEPLYAESYMCGIVNSTQDYSLKILQYFVIVHERLDRSLSSMQIHHAT